MLLHLEMNESSGGYNFSRGCQKLPLFTLYSGGFGSAHSMKQWRKHQGESSKGNNKVIVHSRGQMGKTSPLSLDKEFNSIGITTLMKRIQYKYARNDMTYLLSILSSQVSSQKTYRAKLQGRSPDTSRPKPQHATDIFHRVFLGENYTQWLFETIQPTIQPQTLPTKSLR